ncbi:protein phosphatase methylesterase 1 [Anastrepha ludens]|uniref:protein phosphatase methylesterase 1 n=1 Tax=Anastrepha ludens TaxID=28586 RepID=UPI0023B1119D|nr:protein phosphatase methylesterase 1 [Anastrepha ludens]XP_053952651.1 protein phosphatase methylesterase 1 [Anastrepha ludens]XP_053952653.1 protein phosphatase methylesterase 1 [Anastrepha ludens]
MSNLQRTVLKNRLPPTVPGGRIGRSDSFKKSRIRDFKPALWSDFFAEKEDVILDEKRTFRVYRTKQPQKAGPVLLLLHGGGYSGLTWSYFCVEITRIIHCQCLAVDLRGHGDTKTEHEDDLSSDTLAQDIGDLVLKLYPEDIPPLYLVGHSMGGAIAVHFAHTAQIPSIIGITVIDIVEGTAMEALASMQSFLRSRPTYFKSIPSAIEWCIRSGQVRNVDSAKASMPGQIINCTTKQLATNELPLADDEIDDGAAASSFTHPFSISEDEEMGNDNGGEPTTSVAPTVSGSENDGSSDSSDFKKPFTAHDESPKRYTWRIDLSKSEKYWVGWFTGLSEKFLNLRVPKQLLLASIDGLDKTLIVGQMQGRFQMQVLARCGHAVHEDRPHEVAEVISAYLIRNRFAEAAGEFHFHLPTC